MQGKAITIQGRISPPLKTFAFWILPTIIFFSSLMTVLYYLGVMQKVVKGMAWVMMRTMKTSGAETLSAAGNIFLGQTEAPLLIKPFIERMTMSELHTVMTAGFIRPEKASAGGSTSTAASLARDKPGASAIASRHAAVEYGLDILCDRIEDNAHNVTRFAIIGDLETEPAGLDRTALLLQISHKPGSLSEALQFFKLAKINLTWIESFPMVGSNSESLLHAPWQ